MFLEKWNKILHVGWHAKISVPLKEKCGSTTQREERKEIWSQNRCLFLVHSAEDSVSEILLGSFFKFIHYNSFASYYLLH